MCERHGGRWLKFSMMTYRIKIYLILDSGHTCVSLIISLFTLKTETDDMDIPKLTGYLKSCDALVKRVKYEDNKINLFNDALHNKDLIVSTMIYYCLRKVKIRFHGISPNWNSISWLRFKWSLFFLSQKLKDLLFADLQEKKLPVTAADQTVHILQNIKDENMERFVFSFFLLTWMKALCVRQSDNHG